MTKFRRVVSLALRAAILIAVPILYAYIWYARNDDSVLEIRKADGIAYSLRSQLNAPPDTTSTSDDIYHLPEYTNIYLRSLMGREMSLAHFLECLSRDDLLRSHANNVRYFSIRINSSEEMSDSVIAYKYSIIYYSRTIFIASKWRDSSFLTKRRHEVDSFVLVRVICCGPN